MARTSRSIAAVATVAALLATGVVLAGPATVAEAGRLLTGNDIKNGSLTSRDYRNGSVRGIDIKNGTITARDLAPGLAPRGAPGAPGADGADGADGAPGSSSGGEQEVGSWSVSAPDAPSVAIVTRTSGGSVPAGARVEAIRLDVSQPGASRCSTSYLELKVGDRGLATWNGGAPSGPGRTVLRPAVVLDAAAPLKLTAECDDGFESVPSPAYEADVLVRWTVAPTEPTVSLD